MFSGFIISALAAALACVFFAFSNVASELWLFFGAGWFGCSMTAIAFSYCGLTIAGQANQALAAMHSLAFAGMLDCFLGGRVMGGSWRSGLVLIVIGSLLTMVVWAYGKRRAQQTVAADRREDAAPAER